LCHIIFSGFDIIMMVRDCLTKQAHFEPCREDMDVEVHVKKIVAVKDKERDRIILVISLTMMSFIIINSLFNSQLSTLNVTKKKLSHCRLVLREKQNEAKRRSNKKW
jgi:hypothetical protein